MHNSSRRPKSISTNRQRSKRRPLGDSASLRVAQLGRKATLFLSYRCKASGKRSQRLLPTTAALGSPQRKIHFGIYPTTLLARRSSFFRSLSFSFQAFLGTAVSLSLSRFSPTSVSLHLSMSSTISGEVLGPSSLSSPVYWPLCEEEPFFFFLRSRSSATRPSFYAPCRSTADPSRLSPVIDSTLSTRDPCSTISSSDMIIIGLL